MAAVTVAIVGSGISGLACATELIQRGASVTIFEKESRPGGRMRVAKSRGVEYDAGVVTFAANDAGFKQVVREWINDGIVSKISVSQGTAVLRKNKKAITTDGAAPLMLYAGSHLTASIARYLASSIDIEYNSPVTNARHVEGSAKWTLFSDDKQLAGDFDQVVFAVPAPQLIHMLSTKYVASASLLSQSSQVPFKQNVQLTVFLPTASGITVDMIHLPVTSVILTATRSFPRPAVAVSEDGTPAGSPAGSDAGSDASGESEYTSGTASASSDAQPVEEIWTCVAAPEWAETHWAESDEAIEKALLADLCRFTTIPPTSHAKLNRWMYYAPEPLAQRYLVDTAAGLGICGDWCGGPGVEAAYLSGKDLAVRLSSSSNGTTPPTSRRRRIRRRPPSANSRNTSESQSAKISSERNSDKTQPSDKTPAASSDDDDRRKKRGKRRAKGKGKKSQPSVTSGEARAVNVGGLTLVSGGGDGWI